MVHNQDTFEPFQEIAKKLGPSAEARIQPFPSIRDGIEVTSGQKMLATLAHHEVVNYIQKSNCSIAPLKITEKLTAAGSVVYRRNFPLQRPIEDESVLTD